MVPRWAPTAGLGLLSRALLRAAEPRAARALSDKAAAGPHQDREGLLACKRVVIKVGTAVVSNADGTLALSRLGALVEQVETAQRAFLLRPGESETPPC